MKEEVVVESDKLYATMTYMKTWAVKRSITSLIEIERRTVQKRHDKKLGNLLKEKAKTEGTRENPNKTIWNFSSHVLTDEEHDTLKYGLRHGIAKQPDEYEILASAEAVWNQIASKELCKDGGSYQRRAKNHLRAMAFNLINIQEDQIYKDKRKITIIRDLKEKVVLLTPDKGNGVVLMDVIDYKDSMHALFADRSKFRTLPKDPTNARFSSLQQYLRRLKNRGEITEEDYKTIYPKNAKIGRAHGSAKVHKEYTRIPPLRPIVDTIGSTHYGVGKYISRLLHPLTLNNYHLKDSFDAAEKIKAIPAHLFEEGYRLVSFDVKSLFTNVPLNKTIQIIMNRVYKEKAITTLLKQRTLKKLINDTCSKTAFLCDNVIYEQIDGVSMGAALGPVLANIIMTELERVVVDKLIGSGKIKFYARYVDDTLLLVKPEDIDNILNQFNAYHNNLEFTVDKFEDCVPHFLDLEIHPDGISIYRKETHTAQFVHFESFTKWNHKVAWIRSLCSRAKKLCTPNKLTAELDNIKRFASYNGFPRWIVNKIMKQVSTNRPTNNDEEEEEVKNTIYMFLPYAGKEAESVVLRCKKRLFKLFKNNLKVEFRVHFQTAKLSFYTSNKDKTPLLSNSFLVYEYSCPGCLHTYIGKTESTLFNRTNEHGWSDKKSAINRHFHTCSGWQHIVGLLQMNDEEVDQMALQINAVRENTKIIKKTDNWLKLAFLESILIKENQPELNKGIKSCKELALF
jgi:hypothetical protein